MLVKRASRFGFAVLRFIKFLTGVPWHGMVMGLEQSHDISGFMSLMHVYWAMVPPLLLFAAVLLGSCWLGWSACVGLLLGTLAMAAWLIVVFATKTDGFAK